MVRMLLVMLVAIMAGGAVADVPVSFGQSQLEIVVADGTRHGFDIELAQTDAQLHRGLMGRAKLAATAGMLFDFGHEQPVAMWMKDTLIPLDMVFIAKDGTIVGIAERTLPHSLAIISSPHPARAVLELNGGTASRLGIHAGDRVVHSTFGNG
jgi:uncharacterized protein